MNTHRKNKKAGPLTIRVAGGQELKRFNQLLDERHPQQAPPPVGRELRVVIEQDGDWIAAMLWTSTPRPQTGDSSITVAFLPF